MGVPHAVGTASHITLTQLCLYPECANSLLRKRGSAELRLRRSDRYASDR